MFKKAQKHTRLHVFYSFSASFTPTLHYNGKGSTESECCISVSAVEKLLLKKASGGIPTALRFGLYLGIRDAPQVRAGVHYIMLLRNVYMCGCRTFTHTQTHAHTHTHTHAYTHAHTHTCTHTHTHTHTHTQLTHTYITCMHTHTHAHPHTHTHTYTHRFLCLN